MPACRSWRTRRASGTRASTCCRAARRRSPPSRWCSRCSSSTRRRSACSTRSTRRSTIPTPCASATWCGRCRRRPSSCSSATTRSRWKWRRSWSASPCPSRAYRAWARWTSKRPCASGRSSQPEVRSAARPPSVFMSDLVLGLLVLGMLLFAGVLLYNRWQERAAQRAFGSSHPDALLAAETSAARHEPTLHKAEPPRVALPDRRVDYIMEVRLPHPGMLEGWSSVEQRFARRAMLVPGEDDATWHAALQLVSRAGVVNEAELIEFRSAVETLGAKAGATVSAPEMRSTLEAARELDKTCADSDIQVALHVIGQGIEPPPDEQPFQVVRREDGVTLVLDVALTPDL